MSYALGLNPRSVSSPCPQISPFLFFFPLPILSLPSVADSSGIEVDWFPSGGYLPLLSAGIVVLYCFFSVFEEEAKKKIYSVSTTTYTGFGALVSQELSQRLKALLGVLWVLLDSYLDVPRKDYGGDLLVDGKLVPRPEYRFSKQEPREMVDFNVLDLEDSENCKESAKANEDVDGSFLVSERLKETIKNVKQSRSEDLEGPVEVTNQGPTKNVETTKVGGTEDLAGHRPMFDGLKETMKTTKREPSHEDLEETADDEETAALFDRLREKMKNVKIEPAKSSGEDSDWPDMWSDKYYEKDEDPRTKLTQEQLDALTVQLQEFKKELMQHKDENKDG